MSAQPSTEDLSERARNGFLYYTIPASVFEDEDLIDSEVLFYALISNLSTKDGYCYASTGWLAKKRKVDESTIKRWLEKLESLGYIRRLTQKIGMNWDRKIYIDIPKRKTAPPPMDSNKVYEGSFSQNYEGSPKAHPCTDRGGTSKPIIEEDLNIKSSTTPTPPNAPSSSSPDPQRERWWGKMKEKFGESLKKEVFEKAWNELSKMDASQIKSVEKLLASLVDKWLICGNSKKDYEGSGTEERAKRIEKHKQQAQKESEGPCSRYFDISISDTCVYFSTRTSPKKVCPISYGLTDEEWEKQTGWKAYAS